MKIYKGQMLYYYNKNSHMCESVAVILVCPDKQSFAVRWEGDVVWRSFDSIGKTLFTSRCAAEAYHCIPFNKRSTRSVIIDNSNDSIKFQTLGRSGDRQYNCDAWNRSKR